MQKNISKRLFSWYLENFADTTKEIDDEVPIMSVIGVVVEVSLKDRLKFLFTNRLNYRLTLKQVTFIKKF